MPRSPSLPNIWLPPSSRPSNPMLIKSNKSSLLTPPLTPSSSLGSVATDPQVSRILSVSPISPAVEDAFFNFTLRIAFRNGNPIHSSHRSSEENSRVIVLNDTRDAVSLQQIFKNPPNCINQYLQDNQVATAFLSVDQFVELCGHLPVADLLRNPAFCISVVPIDDDPESSVRAFLMSKGALYSFHRQQQFLFEAEFFSLKDTSALWDHFKSPPVVTPPFTLNMHWLGAKPEHDEVIYTTTPTDPSPHYTFPPNVPSPTMFVPPPPPLPPHIITSFSFPHPPPLPHIMSPPFFHGPGTHPLPFHQPPVFINHNGWYDYLPSVPGPPPPMTEYWLPAPPPGGPVGPIQNEAAFVDTALANVAYRENQRYSTNLQLNAMTTVVTTPIESICPPPPPSVTDTSPSDVPQGRHDNSNPPSPIPASPSAPLSTPKCNLLSISRISSGVDTRTTIMLKNIPNKMSCEDLINFINGVVERRIDFLYLRMDFSNDCNFGYAFVNFIAVEDLLEFAKARLGRKWNMFQSEKVLEMCYANYQGKEALVEKFKNSCIMDERSSWIPKIFYSERGPTQGLPEPFPKATHQRRRERGREGRFGTGNVNGGGATLGTGEAGTNPELIAGRRDSHSHNHHADLQMLRPGGGYRPGRRNRGRAATTAAQTQSAASASGVFLNAVGEGQVVVPSGLVGPAV